eukprot:scaffold3345_cov164-Ochromonas_danica.AAC.2
MEETKKLFSINCFPWTVYQMWYYLYYKIAKTRFFTSVASISQQIQPLPEFDKPGFQAVRALDLLSEEEVGPALLPSASYPSDHLAITAARVHH